MSYLIEAVRQTDISEKMLRKELFVSRFAHERQGQAEELGAAFIYATSLWRKLRGICIDEPEHAQLALKVAERTLDPLMQQLHAFMKKEETRGLTDLARSFQNLQHKEGYSKYHADNILSNVPALVSSFVRNDWYQMHKFLLRGNNEFIENNLAEEGNLFPQFQADFADSNIQRIVFLGPLSSGWKEAAFSKLAFQQYQRDTRSVLGIPDHVGVTHLPVTFEARAYKDSLCILPENEIRSTDLLVIMDESLSETRYAQLSRTLKASGIHSTLYVNK